MKKISKLIIESDKKIFQSIDTYSQAQALLEKELRLDTFTPSTRNTAEKSFSEIFKTGRLDAEYFMPKYDEIDDIMLSNSDTLENNCKIYKKNFNPEAKK